MHIRRPRFFNRHAQRVGWSVETKAFSSEDSRTTQTHHRLRWIERRLHQKLRRVTGLGFLLIGNQFYFFFFNSSLRRTLATSYPQRQLAFVRASTIVANRRPHAIGPALFRSERAARGAGF